MLLNFPECRHFVSGYEIRGYDGAWNFRRQIINILSLTLCTLETFFRKGRVYRNLRCNTDFLKTNFGGQSPNLLRVTGYLFWYIFQDVNILNTEPGCILPDWIGFSKLKYLHCKLRLCCFILNDFFLFHLNNSGILLIKQAGR